VTEGAVLIGRNPNDGYGMPNGNNQTFLVAHLLGSASLSDQLQEGLAVNKSFAEETPRSAAILNHLHAVILSCLIPGPPFM
jgi:hypothetical protein